MTPRGYESLTRRRNTKGDPKEIQNSQKKKGKLHGCH